MNATHATVGMGTTTATVWLTTLLTGFHGLDADHAGAMAGLITIIVGGIGMVAGRIVAHNWPWLVGNAPNPPNP